MRKEKLDISAHWDDHVKPQHEGGHVQAKKGSLRRNQLYQSLDLGPPAFRTVKNEIFVF